MTASLTLLAPWTLTLCVLAVVPIVTLIVVERRQRRVVAALGLAPAQSTANRWAAGLAAVACLALGVAAARPVITSTTTRDARTASEVLFVVDVSRSMTASPARGAATRLERARRAAVSLRNEVPDVPAGVAGLTDRVLPYLFPTLDLAAFAQTVDRSVTPESPPPDQVATVATSFDGLSTLGSDGFFSPRARTRTCVLLTDGETRTGDESSVFVGSGATAGDESPSAGAAELAAVRGCTLVVVGVGGPGDRIRDARGAIEGAYRPEPSAAATLRRLADDAGGTLATTGSLGPAAKALRSAAEVGPTRQEPGRTTYRSLAALLVALGAAAAVAALAAGGALRLLQRRPSDYDLARPAKSPLGGEP
jgi:hypothetical protein